MSVERVPDDARRALSRLAAHSSSGAIAQVLMTDGLWRHADEWRIGTVTEEQIDLADGRFRVVSKCGLTFTMETSDLSDALEALAVFWSLHPLLFYGLGWPGYANPYLEGGSGEATDVGDNAGPYVARLANEARDWVRSDLGTVEAALRSRGVWEHDGATIVFNPRKPDLVDVSVRRKPIEISFSSQSIERAAFFLGITLAIADDMIEMFGWAA